MTKTEQADNGSKVIDDSTAVAKSGDLAPQIVKQVEFYFGDYNLPRDKFMKEQIELEDGWVSMETMLKFKRLSNISSNPSVILTALKGSDLMMVDEEKQMIRRCPDLPLPEWTDERRKELAKQTIYLKGLDKEKTTHDEILPFFEGFDNVQNVQLRYFTNRKDNTKGFKGSIFVTFKDKETAEKFMALKKVTYKDVDLERKWQESYFEEKKKEVEDRKKEKMDKKKKIKLVKDGALEEKMGAGGAKEAEEGLPKGSILHITGLNDKTSREDIKDQLKKDFDVALEDIAFVFYQKGETEAKLRFKTENAAKNLMAKIPEGGIFEVNETKVTAKVLEGEEEEAFLKQCSNEIKEIMSKSRKRSHGGHKNRGGFRGGRGGRGAKRQRL